MDNSELMKHLFNVMKEFPNMRWQARESLTGHLLYLEIPISEENAKFLRDAQRMFS